MTDQTTPQTISAALKDAIREAGGIVHGDGNIFFTNAEQFTKAALAASAPAPMHAVPNLTLEPEMRAAMQAVFDAESVPVRPAPLTDTFVQTVPDKCDRIVWRNSYYHLPIAAAPKADHIDDDLAMVPAAPQQGEYLPLPVPAFKLFWDGGQSCYKVTKPKIDNADVFTVEQIHAYVDADRADRASRGAAQAAPITEAEQAAWHAGLDEGRSQARGASPAPVAEDAEDAARYRWLKLQARPNEPFELFDKLREAHALVKAFDVFCTRWGGWDASIDAARAQAAQPEGAKP